MIKAGKSQTGTKIVESLTFTIDLEIDVTDLESLQEILDKMAEHAGYKITDVKVNRA